MSSASTANIPVHVAGNVVSVCPTERWVVVNRQLHTATGQHDAVFVHTSSDDVQQVISADYIWKQVLATVSNAGANASRILHLQLLSDLEASKEPPKAGCCTSSAPPCCPSASDNRPVDIVPLPEKSKRTCTHPIVGEFSQPTDVRYTPLPGYKARPVVENECQKCDSMFNTTSPVDKQHPPPRKIKNPTLSQYKYSGESLRCCQLPLGPLGGGCIAVSGDGGLRQWQIVNEVNHVGHVPDSFWGIKVETSSGTHSRVLQSDALYGKSEFVPAFEITDHIVPPGSIDLLKKLPGVPNIEVTAKYPTVEVNYPDNGLSVGVHMTAWNPCIPLDEDNSGIPVIVFQFDVSNPSNEAVQVSLLNSQQNMVGWDGHSAITAEVVNKAYGGNSNSLLKLNDNMTAIDMFNPSLSDPNGHDYDMHDGHFASCAISQAKDVVSSLVQYDSVESMWTMFTSAEGLHGPGQSGPSPAGRTWNGALALTRTVAAHATETFTFCLAWHFPHRATNWSQASVGNLKPPIFLGNRYATLFKDISTVLKTTHDRFTGLQKYTFKFRDCMFNSTLPWQLIDSAAGRVSPLRSPTCMWIADGRFLAFEGCREQNGCCPLNCTHVWNYEQSLANLWPALEQNMRDVDLGAGKMVTPSGRLVSRAEVPLFLRPQWLYWPGYDVDLNSTKVCVDGEIGAVLKLYREVRMGASAQFFKTMWPDAKKIMHRWMTVNDQGDGTMKIAQPSTYDEPLYGVNTFTGALYLCALKAAEKMALMQDEQDLAKAYSARYVLGRTSLDKKCWVNGQWYTQEVDPENQTQIISDSTFVDCLLGQWWGYILDLGDILPYDHCSSTVLNIYAHNHIDAFVPSTQQPRPFYDQRDAGMVIASWSSGVPPKNRLRYSTECAWTGLAHYFASLCIYLGQVDIGLTVLEDSRYCYDGTHRSPWNEIECGDHYSRPMCAFQLFATASGITWDALHGEAGLRLGFNPRIGPSNYCGFFNLPTCWGQYSQLRSADLMSGTAQVTVAYGTLIISELWLPFQNDDIQQISLTLGANQTHPITVDHIDLDGVYLKLFLHTPLSIGEGNLFLKVSIGQA